MNLTDHAILRKLIESGIEIFEIKGDYLEENLEHLGDSFLIRDPYDPTRKTLDISGGLTEKLWHQVSTVYHSSEDLHIENSTKRFEEISENVKRINISDLTKLEKIKNYRIKRKDKESIRKAVSAFNKILNSTNYEIKLFDGHMRNPKGTENLRFYLSYLCKHLKKDIVIQIVTCGHNHDEVKKDQLFFQSTDHNVHVVSFDEKGYENPLHRRFVVVDKQKSIRLDKGLRFLFDFFTFGNANNESIIEIHSSNDSIDSDLKTFEEYWNYEHTPISGIKEWPKIDTRRKNES